MIEKLVIIGSGPAGYTAALYASRAGLNPILFAGKQPGGQLMSTQYVYNWPGDEKILGPDLMKNMRKQVEGLGVRIIEKDVTGVDFSEQPFLVQIDSEKFKTCSVIIATGSNAKKTGVPGEEKYWGKGVSTCAVCDGPLFKDKRVLIVGGGDRGVENALFMMKYASAIILIQNIGSLTAEYVSQQELFESAKVEIKYNTILTNIEGDGQKVTSATLKDVKTDKTESIEVSGIFISIGMEPNTEIFKNQIKLDSEGYIILSKRTQTSQEGIFAAGDVIDKIYKQAVTAASSGSKAALDVSYYLKAIEGLTVEKCITRKL